MYGASSNPGAESDCAVCHVNAPGTHGLSVTLSEAQRERVVANERIFRGENRTILEEAREEGAVPIGRLISFYCECGELECLSRLLLSAREYEQIHADPRRFCLIAGHEDPRVERVIAETDRYAVVQKLD